MLERGLTVDHTTVSELRQVLYLKNTSLSKTIDSSARLVNPGMGCGLIQRSFGDRPRGYDHQSSRCCGV